MNAKSGKLQSAEPQPRFNLVKWILLLCIIIVAIAANVYYAQVAWALRAAVGIVVLVVVLAIAYQTRQGKKAWKFIKAARTELRKVVWPTRQETIQTTIIVVCMVVLTALILWGLDSFFLWAVGWLTGQRG